MGCVFHPALAYRDEPGRYSPFPALVAAVTNCHGALEGVQRTWLHPDRVPPRPRSPSPARPLGLIHGHAVRFGALPANGATLLVGEGIKTILSLVAAIPALPGAAALSAGSLAAFVPPLGVARLLIAATVLTPEGGDFNDDLTALGPQALTVRLAPLLGTGP